MLFQEGPLPPMGMLSPEVMEIGLEQAVGGLTKGCVRALPSSEGLEGEKNRETVR